MTFWPTFFKIEDLAISCEGIKLEPWNFIYGIVWEKCFELKKKKDFKWGKRNLKEGEIFMLRRGSAPLNCARLNLSLVYHCIGCLWTGVRSSLLLNDRTKDGLWPLTKLRRNPWFKLVINLWQAKLAYLDDIFSRLNAANKALQGTNATAIEFVDKLNSFRGKLELCKAGFHKTK